VVYAATSVAELEPPSEPEPATVAPAGTGNWLGQPGGSWPSRDSDTWPLGVETWKFLAVIFGVGLAGVVAGLAAVVAGLAVDELLLEQPAAAARLPSRRPAASRDFTCSPLRGRWYKAAATVVCQRTCRMPAGGLVLNGVLYPLTGGLYPVG